MLHKVFFVEDEIVTREGIRDNVDWKANGFEFCGEATDGEMALPLLRASQPNVLITDIKMPFVDGLQLSRIVRERMPWTPGRESRSGNRTSCPAWAGTPGGP